MLVLVSYVPLLRGLPGQLVDPAAVAPLLDTGAGHVEAVVWAVGDGGEFLPMLAMARAEEVFEHLVEWSEGSPATWFKLLIDENDDEYAMALVPDVQRSLDRFHVARSLIVGADVPPAEVRVVFQPLVFRGPKSDVSRQVLPTLRDEVAVGFVDVEALRAGLERLDCAFRPWRLDPRAASRIGPLRCERGPDLLARS
jgi:hypothetical protein